MITYDHGLELTHDGGGRNLLAADHEQALAVLRGAVGPEVALVALAELARVVAGAVAGARNVSLGGTACLMPTCLMRPHLFCVLSILSRIIMLKTACVRQVVLDKWFPLISARDQPGARLQRHVPRGAVDLYYTIMCLCYSISY